MKEANESSDFEADQPSNNEVDQENNVNTKKRTKKEKVKINGKNSSKIAEIKRQKGEAYTNRAGKLIPAKVVNFGVLCSEGCRRKCSEKFNSEERKKIFSRYYSFNNEHLKSVLLLKGISCQVPSRRRSRTLSGQPKAATFMYSIITIGNRSVPVCKTAFCSLYQIGKKKIKLLQEDLKRGLDTPKIPQEEDLTTDQIK